MRAHALSTVAPILLLTAGLLLPVATGGADDAPAGTEALEVPEGIRTEGVPPIPASLSDELLAFNNQRWARFQSWHPSERRMLITTRFGQTGQLHEVRSPLGARHQVTFFDERVPSGSYRPADPAEILFSMDAEGSENYQLLMLDRERNRIRHLSDGEHRFIGARWSDDGHHLAYVSNQRNGKDFDLYVVDPSRPQSARRVVELEGSWVPTDWSPDGERLLLVERFTAELSHIHAVDLTSGTVTRVTPPPPEGEEVAWWGAEWGADGESIYVTTNRDSNFFRLVRLDLDDGRIEVITDHLSWDVEGFVLSRDGARIAVVTNEDGISRLRLYDTTRKRWLPAPEVPPGEIDEVAFRPGSYEVAFTLDWARSPSDVYSYDPATGRLERWTESEVGGLDPGRFTIPELVRFPTFDEVEPGKRRTIPAFVYRPDPERHPGPRPVYINIHGGPESQSRPGFRGTYNYLIRTLGIALIYPNVRGSAGYGKEYLGLDNGRRREDAVRDIGALLDWIATQPDLDAERVMVGGGSYGGYMALAALVHYGDRLRAGFDYVGISNFVTFLENTQEYRRELRRLEYGDERKPQMREFLESISPANHADQLTDPLLIAQGANDPRVPLSESDQMVASLADAEVPVWYIVGTNEGHGFYHKDNADYLRMAWVEFVRRNLLGEEAPGEAMAAGTGSSER